MDLFPLMLNLIAEICDPGIELLPSQLLFILFLTVVSMGIWLDSEALLLLVSVGSICEFT